MVEVDPAGSILEFVRWRPAPPLRPLVVWYTGYRSVGIPPGRHRGLPSPHLTLIVALDDPLIVAAHPDPRTPPGEYATLVGGLHTRPALITHNGSQSGIQLGLTPLGARALLGCPAGELADTDLDAVDVLGPVAHELRERVRHASGWGERFAVLDTWLSRRARTGRGLPAEVGQAWDRLLDTRGALAVSQLAREVGWSTRHLGNRFRAEIGLTPKEAARVVRFHHARCTLQRQVAAGRTVTLAELAAMCGYYDQAHLAREFRALAGCPPTQWLAEEFRNIQADAALATPDWPA